MVIVVRSCCCNCWYWCRFCNLKIIFWWSLITSCLLDYDLTERAPDRAWKLALGALSNCLNPCHNTIAVIAIFIVILTTHRWGQTIAVANFLRMPIVQILSKIDMFILIDQNYLKLLTPCTCKDRLALPSIILQLASDKTRSLTKSCSVCGSWKSENKNTSLLSRVEALH